MAPKKDPQIRIAAAVIIGAMLLWMGASWIGGALGMPTRFAFLFDFAALAAFVFAMVVLYRVWKKGQ